MPVRITARAPIEGAAPTKQAPEDEARDILAAAAKNQIECGPGYTTRGGPCHQVPFYVDRMHEHNVLANRTICWRITEHVNHTGKVVDKQIALSRDTRCATADHENFLTGCEHKPAIKWRSRSDQPYGKRKFSDSPGLSHVLQVDQIGTYSASDLQKLNAVFAAQSSVKPSTAESSQTADTTGQWRHGQVPLLGPATEGRARASKQLEYARTLLAVTAKAAAQMEEGTQSRTD